MSPIFVLDFRLIQDAKNVLKQSTGKKDPLYNFTEVYEDKTRDKFVFK